MSHGLAVSEETMGGFGVILCDTLLLGASSSASFDRGRLLGRAAHGGVRARRLAHGGSGVTVSLGSTSGLCRSTVG